MNLNRARFPRGNDPVRCVPKTLTPEPRPIASHPNDSAIFHTRSTFMSNHTFTKSIPNSHYTGNLTPPNFFYCQHCGAKIPTAAPGTKNRNHCPHCLWSLHLDTTPGDRKSACKAPMQPIAVTVQVNGEWSIIHRCTSCRALNINRIAGDDNEFQLLSLAAKPLSKPPFPLLE